jgi:hypothetical protein
MLVKSEPKLQNLAKSLPAKTFLHIFAVAIFSPNNFFVILIFLAGINLKKQILFYLSIFELLLRAFILI